MYKILLGLAPAYVNCAIVRNVPARALRPASVATLLAVTVPRRTVARSSFAVAGRPNYEEQLAKVDSDLTTGHDFYPDATNVFVEIDVEFRRQRDT
ncbi:hypothetical protein NP493_437g00020 [Ridgeia piscesae]|uniref:Uncharacterized protein n=1 Tax=Ridgeia piscesae TaxID=27915 RepID=A0AAD9NTY1_RIDPI|nr:hypothetical protein NP493_437g00020 [Ridgeia piscesae]